MLSIVWTLSNMMKTFRPKKKETIKKSIQTIIQDCMFRHSRKSNIVQEILTQRHIYSQCQSLNTSSCICSLSWYIPLRQCYDTDLFPKLRDQNVISHFATGKRGLPGIQFSDKQTSCIPRSHHSAAHSWAPSSRTFSKCHICPPPWLEISQWCWSMLHPSGFFFFLFNY